MHFGFHTYHGPGNGEYFYCIDHPTGHSALYVEELLGVWHCYEVAVQPSTRSIKFWFDGTPYTNWTDSFFCEATDITPQRLTQGYYYGRDDDGDRTAQTNNYWNDDIIVKSGTDEEESDGDLYIGLTDGGPPSLSTIQLKIKNIARPQNFRKIHPKF